jgi:KamA family protein
MAKWQELLQQSIRNPEDLQSILHLSDAEARQMAEIAQNYPVCINPYYLSLVNPDDPNDPIRKMCVPDVREFSEGGQRDTSGEADNTVLQGMQHKYQQTALILSTNQCAMYCRHCFRKRMVGLSSEEVGSHIPDLANYVRAHTEINNVLISGGDSFLNSNELIKKYLDFFTEIPTLDFIRFGTRTPVVLPQRITEDEQLLTLLGTYGRKKQIIIVTQFNHPRELTPESIASIEQLRDAGCIIRNQTVLLKGVNDQPETLATLMNALVAAGVIPYYIFQCRPVIGVKNQFQVPILEGIRVVNQARSFMNGQSKSVRYAMSHPTGKIEFIGCIDDNRVIMKYHQAKYEKDQSRIFILNAAEKQCWIDEIPA